MSPARQKARRGRYDVRNVSEPRGGLSPSALLNSRTALAAVDDPENPKRRHLARVNVRTDALEIEHAAHRITETEYLIGRLLAAVFERGSGTAGKSSYEPGDRGDPSEARLALMVKKLDDAATVVFYESRLKADVGELGARFLRKILAEGQSFSAMAGALAGERAIAFQGGRFRAYLGELAESRFWLGTIGYA